MLIEINSLVSYSRNVGRIRMNNAKFYQKAGKVQMHLDLGDQIIQDSTAGSVHAYP